MPAKIHATQEGFVRAGLAGLNKLKQLGVLTSAIIGTITATGTKAKLQTAIETQRTAITNKLQDAQQIREYDLAYSEVKRLLDLGIILDADVETARAAVTDKFTALHDPIMNLLTFPQTIVNAGKV